MALRLPGLVPLVLRPSGLVPFHRVVGGGNAVHFFCCVFSFVD